MKKREVIIVVLIACLSLIGLFFLNKKNNEPVATPTPDVTSSPEASDEPTVSMPTEVELPSEEAKGEWIGVIHRGRVILWFDSGVNNIYTVYGLVGEMNIEVENGEWHISYVDCPNHTCEKMGWMNVDSIGVPITCLPNDILIAPYNMLKNMVLEQ